MHEWKEADFFVGLSCRLHWATKSDRCGRSGSGLWS